MEYPLQSSLPIDDCVNNYNNQLILFEPLVLTFSLLIHFFLAFLAIFDFTKTLFHF